jgi:hypothetical protein
MKRHVMLAIVAAGIYVAGNLTSCTKIASELPAPITALTDSVTPPVNRITMFYGQFSEVNDSIKITYNSIGNPVSMIGSRTTYLHLKQRFQYDANNRLTAIVGIGNDQLMNAHKYLYDAQNRVVTDSFLSGISGGRYDTTTLNTWGTTPMFTDEITYDSQNRISKVLRKQHSSSPDTLNYTYYYNSAGNIYKINQTYIVKSPAPEYLLSSDEFFSYDSQVNPHQLHPIWQMIDRNYSKNNAFGQNPYTLKGFPMFLIAQTGHSTNFLLYDYRNLTLNYAN